MPSSDKKLLDAELKILLPDSLKHALQVRAVSERRTVSEIVRQLIAAYLDSE